MMPYGEVNERWRLTKKVESPGRTKCHPSSSGATMPSQLAWVLKPAAVTGVAVFGLSGTWYGLPVVSADPVPALTTTK